MHVHDYSVSPSNEATNKQAEMAKSAKHCEYRTYSYQLAIDESYHN